MYMRPQDHSGHSSSADGSSSSDSDGGASSSGTTKAIGKWTADEHDRFLRAMEQFPIGPWSAIADIVRTRSVRQVHSHAQKYAAKVERHKRGQAKVKRNRITGEHGEPSGHRVVAQIPGKFMSDVAAPERRRRGEKDEKNLVERPHPDHHDETARAAKIVPAPQSQGSSHYDGQHIPRTVVTTDAGPLTDTASGPQPPLPSLDESLDFFIHHFGDT